MMNADLLANFDAEAVLTAAYWICAIVGGGLIVLTLIGGDTDHDIDVSAGGLDVDVDAFHATEALHADVAHGMEVDVGHADLDVAHGDLHVESGHADATTVHGSASALSTWISVRFFVYFAATFGVFGLLATRGAGLETWTAFAIAVVAGGLVGQAVHQLIRFIRRTSGDSTTRPEDYVRRLGRVTAPILHPRQGEVSIQVRGTERCVPAIAVGQTHEFKIGDQVVVVAYQAGVAQIVARSEFSE